MERAPNSKFGPVIVRLISLIVLLIIAAILSFVFHVKFTLIEHVLVDDLGTYNFATGNITR